MRYSYLRIFSVLIFVIGCLTAFIHLHHSHSANNQFVQEVRTNYLKGIDDFVQITAQLQSDASNLTNTRNEVEELQNRLLTTRAVYKKIEFLAAYLDAQFIKDYFNGPPLLSLVENASSIEVMEPEGIQVLEELIFSENPFESKDQIESLTTALAKNAQQFASYQRQVYLTDRHIFEAVRFHLVRVFTLGVTGFDTPVSSDAIEEAEISMQSAFDALQIYFPVIAKKNQAVADTLQETFESALLYLQQHQDFDNFDRLLFLKDYINPLFKQTLKAQLALQIETYYETSPLNKKHSINYFAENIFAEDFLNPYYYADLYAQKDSEKLRNLGQLLFFDPILSSNNERACASCHQPDKAFTDGREKSLATNYEGTIDRNAPTLLNAAYADRFFYDLRTDVLENQIEHVITDTLEFQTSYLTIFDKISKSEEYVRLFEEAFPELNEDPLNEYTISTALSAFVISLKSFNSPFDQYVRGEVEFIEPAVKRGFNLFMGKAACGTCHFAPLFNGSVPPRYEESESEVLGVPVSTDTLQPEDPDMGRFSGNLKDRIYFYEHSFKTTTVRNVALTGPYMHNGVYQTLEEVVDFYNKGGGVGLGLDVPYQTLPFDSLSLNGQEKQDIIAFMKALADTTEISSTIPKKLPEFVNNPKWNHRKIGGLY